MENFVYEYPTKVLFGRGAAKEHLGKALGAYGPNVMLAYGGGSIHWGISSRGRSEQELAQAGVEALADFIAACGLPTRLRGLRMSDDAAALLSPTALREIADSCNLIQTGQAGVGHEEIFEILKECL